MKATTELPGTEWFKHDLNGHDEDVSPEDYSHAQRVWKYFSIGNLLEFCLLYLMIDIFLLG